MILVKSLHKIIFYLQHFRNTLDQKWLFRGSTKVWKVISALILIFRYNNVLLHFLVQILVFYKNFIKLRRKKLMAQMKATTQASNFGHFRIFRWFFYAKICTWKWSRSLRKRCRSPASSSFSSRSLSMAVSSSHTSRSLLVRCLMTTASSGCDTEIFSASSSSASSLA